MNLVQEYKNQYRWRSWNTVYEQLPDLKGQTVLDLGCGIGDQSADLIKQGANVIGVDLNDDLLAEAQTRCPDSARFLKADFRNLPKLHVPVDGIWCSFAVAYVTDFKSVLTFWKKHLKKGGWIALTEIDNFFGHEPMNREVKAKLEKYARESLINERYDFNMGSKLEGYLKEAGFKDLKLLTVYDCEFSFSGPAEKEVITAWEKRFERMVLLHEFCGSGYENVRNEFISCLKKDDHRSLCKVFCCIGTK